jgi:hypothetical protein
MCIIRRGVCPSCATGNLYREPCQLLAATSATQCAQQWPGIQRGGARSCLDHTGRACAPPSPSASSASSAGAASPVDSVLSRQHEHAQHYGLYQQPHAAAQYQNADYGRSYEYIATTTAGAADGMDALAWQMAGCTTDETMAADAAYRWTAAPRTYAAAAEGGAAAPSSPVSWGTVSW